MKGHIIRYRKVNRKNRTRIKKMVHKKKKEKAKNRKERGKEERVMNRKEEGVKRERKVTEKKEKLKQKM